MLDCRTSIVGRQKNKWNYGNRSGEMNGRVGGALVAIPGAQEENRLA
jgi:hypothetical protein